MIETLAKPDASANAPLSRYSELQSNIVTQKINAAKFNDNMKEIKDAAKDFEAVFLSEMLKPIFDQIEPDPMFGGGKGEDIFQGMMVNEYGKMMADRGGVGIAKYVEAEMIRIQEEMNNVK